MSRVCGVLAKEPQMLRADIQYARPTSRETVGLNS